MPTSRSQRTPRTAIRARLFLVKTVVAVAAVGTGLQATASTDLGKPINDPVRLRQLESIRADGSNLPPGQGSVAQGKALYAQHCTACHGSTGLEGPYARLVGSDGFWNWRDPWRPVRIVRQPVLLLSVGAQWPYAPALFDYIRRAMPYAAPKTLTDNEVYAITGYVLLLNDLWPKGLDTVDRTSLARVRMPGLARTTYARMP